MFLKKSLYRSGMMEQLKVLYTHPAQASML